MSRLRLRLTTFLDFMKTSRLIIDSLRLMRVKCLTLSQCPTACLSAGLAIWAVKQPTVSLFISVAGLLQLCVLVSIIQVSFLYVVYLYHVNFRYIIPIERHFCFGKQVRLKRHFGTKFVSCAIEQYVYVSPKLVLHKI